MSIIPQFPDPRAPLASPHWTAIGRWEVPLSYVLNGRYGRRRGSFVYTVLYMQNALYIGMTQKSIYRRLRQHMMAVSNLGRCINAVPIEMFNLDVLEIEGDLCMAERNRISQLEPWLNLMERSRSRAAVDRTINRIIRENKPSKKRKR